MSRRNVDYFSMTDPVQKEQARQVFSNLTSKILYSDKYMDDSFEYRHVILPKEYVRYLPQRLMSEAEWRSIGVQQSVGWQQYMMHKPEPHILLFKRALPPA